MKWLTVVAVAFISSVVFSASSYAETAGQLLIIEVRLGGTTATSIQGESHKQFVSVHNPGQSSVDVSNWRLQYAKASFAEECNASTWSSEELIGGIIDSGATKTVAFSLTDNMAGSVRIIDHNNVVHDMVGWGNDAPCYETQAATPIPQNDKSLVRYVGCDGTYEGADTNNNSIDFVSNQTPLSRVIAPDCVPVCTVDQQLVDNECVDDHCANIDAFQVAIPTGYAAIDRECQEIFPLAITEVLPNVTGSDTGKEFIELFNPTAADIDLKWYLIRINNTVVRFPDGAAVPAGSYMSFSDTDLGISLLNTSSSLQIVSVGGGLVGEEVAYQDPNEDESWANIGGEWQYTTRPTAGAENQPSPVVADENEELVKSCAPNQYRSPETGRCRLVAVAASLAACKEGQIRNEETGRCRKEATLASVKPCKTGQYRSEETNRCRSIATDAKALTPCKEGQERNPDTNRCRNVAAAIDTPGFKTEPVADTGKAFIGWWALGGVGALALGRIGWEWRSEVLSAIQKAGTFFTSGK